VPCDVRDRGDVENAVANIVRRFGGIDVLVNNAGIITVGPAENMEMADYEDAMATHYWGPLYMIQAAVPHLRRAGDARIVNIASFAGLMAVPHMAPYTASKFALVGLSDSLRAELSEQGIAVTTVAPGPLRTGSHVNASFKGQHEREYSWFAGGLAIPGQSTGSDRAARHIIEACRRGDPRLTIGLTTKLAVALSSMLPTTFARGAKVAARMMPRSPGRTGDKLHTGWDSRQSSSLPKGNTGIADREIERNNQAHAPQAPFKSERRHPMNSEKDTKSRQGSPARDTGTEPNHTPGQAEGDEKTVDKALNQQGNKPNANK
jgi:NAD(P)-dependent dehydrogenase (short-subunit alcohol dehydrogenase family)